MSIDLNNPLYWNCVRNRQWQHAAAIRGCSEHQVRMDHKGYDTQHAPASSIVMPAPMRPAVRRGPVKAAAVDPSLHFTHAQKQLWKSATRDRYLAAGVTAVRLAAESGYSQTTIHCSFSPGSSVTSQFMRKIDSVLDRLEALNLPPVERKEKVTADWALAVKRARRARGVTWEQLATVAGYTAGAIQVACREGWALTPTKKAMIEALVGMGQDAAQGEG